MPPPSTDDFAITNYDVLADEIYNPSRSGEDNIGLSLAAHSYHVGNNRLEVLCNIHNQAYSDHQAKGDDSSSAAIIDKIMDIVQNQCVPKGRFLERNMAGEWREVDTAKARQLVRQALTKVENRSSGPTEAEQPSQEIGQKKESDAEKKRRRRSSLLRRSVSSSMLPNLIDPSNSLMNPFEEDKKKSTRRDISPQTTPDNSRPCSPVPHGNRSPRPAFGRSQSVDMGQATKARLASRATAAQKFDSNPVLVDKPLKMDVLLNTAKTALLPGTDLHGNNRLRVMLQIQSAAFQSANEDGRESMAKSLVNTIENFWEGRILSKVPTVRGKSDESYVKLENEHAVLAIKNLLSGDALEKEEELTMGDNPDVNIKHGRRASLKAIQSIAASGAGSNPASILPSSLPALPPDMQHLRSAAVKSLQKRKQRQGLNSRIRGLTADKAAVFQDGSGNASGITSSVEHGATSPIPQNLASPVPSSSKVISNMPSQGMPHMQSYRQTSSGASVASTASQMSTANSCFPPPGVVQRQTSLSNASVGNMSTGSTNTQMTMNTMNAARTMANINLHGRPSRSLQHSDMMHLGASTLMGSELQIPSNMMTALPQLQSEQIMLQQNVTQLQQGSSQLPYIPENVHELTGAFVPRPITAEHLAQMNQAFPSDLPSNHHDGHYHGARAAPQDWGSLYNSTGSDGHPRFSQGEMELLIKGLEMAENQQQQG